MFLKKFNLFFLLLLIISCDNNPNFKISNMQENEDGASYVGQEWKGSYHSQNTDFLSLEDVNSGFAKTLKIVDVDNSFQFIPSASWSYQNNSNAVNSQYAYTNGYPVEKINNKNISQDVNITYTQGASPWQYYVSGNQSYDYNLGTPILKENDGGNVSYIGTWYHYVNGSHNYHYTYTSTDYLEYTFSGTNTSITMLTTYKSGYARIEIYKQSDLNNPVETSEVDLYRPYYEFITRKYHGLKADNYLVRIKGAINKHPSSEGYRVDFDLSRTFPAIEYVDNNQDFGLNIAYKALRYYNYGKVDITPNGDRSKTVRFDLYSPGVSFEYIKAFRFQGLTNGGQPHRITIEATDEKNPNSSGYRFNLDSFGILPRLQFNANTSELNLISLRNQYQGNMDIYVDDDKKATVNLNAPSYSNYFTNYKLTPLSSGNHTVKLISGFDSYIYNINGINLDAYSGLNEATFNIRVKYNNQILKFSAIRGSDQGFVDVYLDGQLKATLDLYSSSNNIPRVLTDFSITNVNSGFHTIKIVPSYTRNSLSSGYNINIDQLKLQTGDSVCLN